MEAIEQIEQDIEDWNENNEKYPVIFDRQQCLSIGQQNERLLGREGRKERQKEMEWLKKKGLIFVRD